MAWNEIAEPLYKRSFDRFETDVTDAEQAAAAPLPPPPSRTVRKPITDLHEVFNAVWFMLAADSDQFLNVFRLSAPFRIIFTRLAERRRF